MIEWMILPPGISCLLILLGAALSFGLKRLGLSFISLGLVILYVTSLPTLSRHISSYLETYPALDPTATQNLDAEAILVIGGGRNLYAPEYGGETVSPESLARIQYSSILQQNTGLPIICSGGRPEEKGTAQALLMQKVLNDDFKAVVPWVEADSTTTYENAIFSYDLLSQKGIDKIILVTHAWHMQRAAEAFRQVGFRVIPAPTGFFQPSPEIIGLRAWIPQSKALYINSIGINEIFSRNWYRYLYYK